MNTFRNNYGRLQQNNTKNYTLGEEVLVSADCSADPKFAVFVAYKGSDFQIFDYVKVFVGGHEITIPSTENNNDEPLIKINGEEEIRLNKTTHYQYPKDDKFYDYRWVEFSFRKCILLNYSKNFFYSIYINDENLLVLEADAVLQYDLKNILSVKVSIVRKMKMCGLCE